MRFSTSVHNRASVLAERVRPVYGVSESRLPTANRLRTSRRGVHPQAPPAAPHAGRRRGVVVLVLVPPPATTSATGHAQRSLPLFRPLTGSYGLLQVNSNPSSHTALDLLFVLLCALSWQLSRSALPRAIPVRLPTVTYGRLRKPTVGYGRLWVTACGLLVQGVRTKFLHYFAAF
jgi:hypothetical protein